MCTSQKCCVVEGDSKLLKVFTKYPVGKFIKKINKNYPPKVLYHREGSLTEK